MYILLLYTLPFSISFPHLLIFWSPSSVCPSALWLQHQRVPPSFSLQSHPSCSPPPPQRRGGHRQTKIRPELIYRFSLPQICSRVVQIFKTNNDGVPLCQDSKTVVHAYNCITIFAWCSHFLKVLSNGRGMRFATAQLILLWQTLWQLVF
jgi:hypothetical protein